jgi:Tfp pilus assembly protein PilV
MMSNMTNKMTANKAKRQRGFSLLEVTVAGFLLMCGAVSVLQVVPFAIQSNLTSRFESTAVVSAERELDQMINQPMTVNSFTDADGNTINLGDPTQSNKIIGNPVLVQGKGVQVDFSATKVAGYNLTRGDPDDPMKPLYDVRWAVVTTVDGSGNAIARRFIVGVWKTNARQYVPPVTLDDWENKYN